MRTALQPPFVAKKRDELADLSRHWLHSRNASIRPCSRPSPPARKKSGKARCLCLKSEAPCFSQVDLKSTLGGRAGSASKGANVSLKLLKAQVRFCVLLVVVWHARV